MTTEANGRVSGVHRTDAMGVVRGGAWRLRAVALAEGARPRYWSWLLFAPLAGCLIFDDYGRRTERDASASGVPTPPTPSGSCDRGDFVCSVGSEGEPDRWRQCGDDGVWSEPVECPSSAPFCNEPARGCVACRARAGRCDGSLFFRCDDRGQERLEADCATEGRVCDFESSGRGCVDCLPGQTRCGDAGELLSCNGQFEFEPQVCVEAVGCIVHQEEPGQLDYCAECNRPGERDCEGSRHYRCSSEHRRELVEDCAASGTDCVALADAGAVCE